MQEILVMRNDTEGKMHLKTFLVDDSALSKLTRIRGNLYEDNPRLRLLKDMPTSLPEPVYSQAAIEATERAVALYKMMRDAKPVTSLPIVKDEPKPMSFEEKIQHDWRFNPSIRKEFVSLASYTAYMRAVRTGRCKVYGGVS